MFLEFNYANMTFDSTLRDLTSLNSASLRFGWLNGQLYLRPISDRNILLVYQEAGAESGVCS